MQITEIPDDISFDNNTELNTNIGEKCLLNNYTISKTKNNINKCGGKCHYEEYDCKKHVGTRFVPTLADCYHCVKKKNK